MNTKKFIVIGSTILVIIVITALLSQGPDDIYLEKSDSNTQTQSTTNITEKVNLKVYLECSGSMHGYMKDDRSNLKTGVKSCMALINSSLELDSIHLNYIGAKIHQHDSCYKFNNTDDVLFKYLNPSYFGFNSRVHDEENPNSGVTREDHNNSKLTDILDSIVTFNRKEDISILITDCIYDPYKGTPENFKEHAKLDCEGLFNRLLKDKEELTVQIIKMESPFYGKYYYKEYISEKELSKSHVHNDKVVQTKYEELNGEKRPYYIWIIGDSKYIAKINEKYEKLSKYNIGSTETIVFSPKKSIYFEIRNQFKLHPKDSEIEIYADFKPLLCNDKWIEDHSNYEIKVQEKGNISKTIEVNWSSEKKIKYDSLKKMTLLPLTLNESKKNLTITLRLKKPSTEGESWIENTSGDNAKDDGKNKKTTGLKYLIDGIANAYDEFNGEYLTTIEIKTTTKKPNTNSKKNKKNKNKK